jgi:hypothetical protein
VDSINFEAKEKRQRSGEMIASPAFIVMKAAE